VEGLVSLDVAIFPQTNRSARFIRRWSTKLLELASPYHSHATPKSAVISYPGLVALYEEDIADAAEYLGVIALKGRHHHQPREIRAAYAGYGMGLCDSYTDGEKC
jgi:hypothetical protein